MRTLSLLLLVVLAGCAGAVRPVALPESDRYAAAMQEAEGKSVRLLLCNGTQAEGRRMEVVGDSLRWTERDGTTRQAAVADLRSVRVIEHSPVGVTIAGIALAAMFIPVPDDVGSDPIGLGHAAATVTKNLLLALGALVAVAATDPPDAEYVRLGSCAPTVL